MNTISASSSLNVLAQVATGMKAEHTGMQLTTAVLKKTLDLQEQQGQALIAMIGQTPSLTGTGTRVNIAA